MAQGKSRIRQRRQGWFALGENAGRSRARRRTMREEARSVLDKRRDKDIWLPGRDAVGM